MFDFILKNIRKAFSKEKIADKKEGIIGINNSTISHSFINQGSGNININLNLHSKESFISDSLVKNIRSMIISKDVELLEKLLNLKLEELKQCIIKMDLTSVECILESLYEIKSCDNVDTYLKNKIFLYEYIFSIVKERKLNFCNINHFGQNANDIKFLESFYKSPKELTLYDIIFRPVPIQFCLLWLLYDKGFYSNIINLCERLEKKQQDDNSYTYPINLWNYFYGLCLFNVRNFKKASIILEKIGECQDSFQKSRQYQAKLLSICAKIQYVTMEIIYGGNNNVQDLKTLYSEFKKLRKSIMKTKKGDSTKINEEIYSGIELQTILVIGKEHEGYLYKFKKIYDGYEDSIKRCPQVIFQLATYYILTRDFKNAINNLLLLDWRNEDIILFKLMYCYLAIHDYKEILNIHNSYNNVPSAKVIGMKLIAEKEIKSKYYQESLESELNKINNIDVESLFFILIGVNEKEDFEKFGIERIRNQIETIITSSEAIKIGYVEILINFQYFYEAKKILYAISNVKIVNLQIAQECIKKIYLFYKEEEKLSSIFVEDESVYCIIENIVEWFIKHHIYEIECLKFIINLLYDECRYNLALQYSERLYSLTKDEVVAVNIIGIVLNNDLPIPNDWDYYIEKLKKSHNIESIFAVAVAYEAIGKEDEANFYLYKALYLLNKDENDEFYSACFAFIHRNISKQDNLSKNMDYIRLCQ